MNERYANRGYNANKKPYYKRGSAVNYVPKAKPQTDTVEKLIEAPAIPIVEPRSNRITREAIISLYKKDPSTTSLLTEWTKNNPDIYSAEPVSPEFLTEFKLPMAGCIASSRKSSKIYEEGEMAEPVAPYYSETTTIEKKSYSRGGYNNSDYYYYEEDVGIVEGNNETSSSRRMANAPLWFDEAVPDPQTTAPDFVMDDVLKRQQDLEEEKKAFLSRENKKTVEEQENADEYSKVDELFEQKMKQGNSAGTPMKMDEIFDSSGILGSTSTETIAAGINAIDLNTLEAGLISQSSAKKGTTVAGKMPEDVLIGGGENDDGTKMEVITDSMPVWGEFTAEEIQKQSKEHIDNWGIDTVKTIEPPIRPAGQYPNHEHSHTPPLMQHTPFQNPFCPGYLHIKEADAAWYYKDLQGVIRGPFTSIDMHRWFIADYFPPTLEIRFRESLPFIALEAFLSAQQKELSAPRYYPEPVYSRPAPRRMQKYEYGQSPQYANQIPAMIKEQLMQPVELKDRDFPVLQPKAASKESSGMDESGAMKLGMDKKGKKAKEALAKTVLGFF